MENTMTSSSITQSFKKHKIIENVLFQVKWKKSSKTAIFSDVGTFWKICNFDFSFHPTNVSQYQLLFIEDFG